MCKKERQIKVGYQVRSNALRKLSVVPALKLSGHWLQAAGFDHGSVVTVAVSEGKLIVELA
jgi:cell division inhibitor SulA